MRKLVAHLQRFELATGTSSWQMLGKLGNRKNIRNRRDIPLEVVRFESCSSTAQSRHRSCVSAAIVPLSIFAQQSATQPAAPARCSIPAKRSICATSASSPSAAECRSLFLRRRQILIFQHQGEGVPCDQIYTMPVDHARRQARNAQAGQHGQGPHHLQLLFSFRRPHSVFLDARDQPGMPAASPTTPRAMSGRFTIATRFTPRSSTAAT